VAFPDKSVLLKHFHMPDDKLLFSKFIDQAYLCVKTGRNTFGGFTDPAKSAKMVEAFGKNAPELYVGKFGGYDGAERLMLGFSVDGVIANIDFPLKALKIAFDKKFKALEHRDILGSVLGLGIDRALVGDVLLKDGYAVVFAKQDMAEFIAANLLRVGRTGVEVSFIDETDELFNVEPVEERRITMSSLRVDAVAAVAFNLSRSDAADLVRKERVFVNWSPVASASKSIGEGDMLTVRGAGRVKVLELEGTTKKERFVVRLLKY